MYDQLIRSALVVDGTGKPAYTGDVGVVGERIVGLATHLEVEAHNVIEAEGLVVAPGFIDAHTHDDLVVLRQAVVPPKVQQGITSLVIGNCGFGMAPTGEPHMEAMRSYAAAVLGEDDQPWNWPTMGALLESMRPLPLGQHVRALLGHTALRVAVMGFDPRPATESEICAQEALVAEAMQAGAAGLSLGLMYMPGFFTPATELVRLARVVGRYGGVITSHMRGEGDYLQASLEEMLTLAKEAEVAVHISHLKVTGRKNWGGIHRALTTIADARARGLSLTVDVYPYTAGSTTITQLLPPWLLTAGLEEMLEFLSDPVVQRRVSQDFIHGLPGWENQVGAVGWERIRMASVQHVEYRVLEGLSFAEAAEQLNLTPEAAFFRLLLEEKGQITVIIFSMDEHDVDQAIQAPFAMLGSDGLPLPSGRPHPRLYGTFPRYIQRYVRELKSFSLEEAVRKITSFPAQRFGLTERGQIRSQAFADLVLFDPNEIRDRATYEKPQVHPAGVEAVIVSGQPVVWRGQLQPHLPGHLLAPAGQLVIEKHQIRPDF